VITAVNGKKISDARELRLMIGSMAPGTKVQIEANREGQTKTFNVELGEMPPGVAEEGAEASASLLRISLMRFATRLIFQRTSKEP
jgi:serine protease Do